VTFDAGEVEPLGRISHEPASIDGGTEALRENLCRRLEVEFQRRKPFSPVLTGLLRRTGDPGVRVPARGRC
jgi:hypothetical protein